MPLLSNLSKHIYRDTNPNTFNQSFLGKGAGKPTFFKKGFSRKKNKKIKLKQNKN